MAKGMVKVMVKPKSFSHGNHSRHPSSSARLTTQQSAKAKGKGKRKKGFSRSSGRQSALILERQGQEERIPKQGQRQRQEQGQERQIKFQLEAEIKEYNPIQPANEVGSSRSISDPISAAAAKQIQRTAALKGKSSDEFGNTGHHP